MSYTSPKCNRTILLFTKKRGQNRANFLEGLISSVFSYKKWTLVKIATLGGDFLLKFDTPIDMSL